MTLLIGTIDDYGGCNAEVENAKILHYIYICGGFLEDVLVATPSFTLLAIFRQMW